MLSEKYAHQNLLLKSIKGERWKDIEGLEDFYMISSFGRVKRMEYEMVYKNGAIYRKPQKIIKPGIVRQRNNLKNDYTRFLVNRVTLNGIRYNLTIARMVYYYFVSSFDLTDKTVVILCKDGDGLNIVPKNLIKSTLSYKSSRAFEKGRNESPLKHLSEKFKKKQRAAIIKQVSKKVSQYSLKGKKIRTFPSIAAAERGTGVHATSIGQRAAGKGISAGGYIWRWGNEKIIKVPVRKKVASSIF